GPWRRSPTSAGSLSGSSEDDGASLRPDAVARPRRCTRHPRRTAPRRHRGQRELAHRGRRRVRGLDARAAAVIRIDAMWLCADPLDMRAGADRLLARVVDVFGAAQAHHGYLFANTRGTRMKLLVHDGFGVW